MFGKPNKDRLEEKLLDVDASIQGTLSFKEPVNLKLNGHFEGALDLRGNLIVGPQAAVNANIKGDNITIAGRVHGDISARVRLRLISTARLVGNIKSPIISIEEGACFHGNCQTFEEAAQGPVNANNDYFTIDELAQFLEVDVVMLKGWAKAGKIPVFKEGSAWRFQRSEIEKWLASEQLK